MARWNTIARGSALAAVAALALAACSTSEDPATSGEPGAPAGDGLIIGSLLPLTGSLAFLGPPEVAGVDLAVKDINDNGGVNGAPVTVKHTDSSDTGNPQITKQSASELVSAGASVVIGAASSSVTLNAIDDITNAGVVQISPANTATVLSGYSPFYFRTAPPDSVQGAALANLIVEDGVKKLGILVFEDDYGTGLRDVIVPAVEAAGVEVVYGKSETFDPAATNFSAEVQAVTSKSPDAIVIIAFDQTKQILPELLATNFPGDKLYFTDGNTSDFSADLPAGAIEGSKGTIPGANPADDFKERLQGVAPEELTDFSYAAESYDATILAALAAIKGGANDGQTIADNLAAVSGANGGEECSSFADCAALLADGKDIQYKGVAGVGPFNANNDPSSAYIGVYVFDGDNRPGWTDAVFGEVPQ